MFCKGRNQVLRLLPLLSRARSYGKNADGRHGQDSVQKDHPGSSCASLHCAAEPVPDLTSEAHSSVCSGIAQLRRESQEAKVGGSGSFQSVQDLSDLRFFS